MVTVYIQLEHAVYCSECDSPTPNLMKHTGFSIPTDAPRWLVGEYPTPETEIVQCNLYNNVQNRDNRYLGEGVGYYDIQLKRWLLKVDVEAYWEARDHPTMDIHELANQNPPDQDTFQYEYEYTREWLAEEMEQQLATLGLTLDDMKYSEHCSGPVIKGTSQMLLKRYAWKEFLPVWLEILNINEYRDSFNKIWNVIAPRYTEVRYYQNILYRNGRAMRIDLPYQQFCEPLYGFAHNHPITRVYCEVDPPSFKRCLIELSTFIANRADFYSTWNHRGGGDGYFTTKVEEQFEKNYLNDALHQYTELEISDLPYKDQYKIVKNNPTIRRLLMRHRLDVLVRTFVTAQWSHIFEKFVDQCREAFRDLESWLGSTEWYKEEIEGRDMVFDEEGNECYRRSLPVLHYLHPSKTVQA